MLAAHRLDALNSITFMCLSVSVNVFRKSSGQTKNVAEREWRKHDWRLQEGRE